MDNQYVLSFDGKDDYVSIPTMNFDYSQGFTVEAWVLYYSFQYWSRIIDFGNGSSCHNIVFTNADTKSQFGIEIYHQAQCKDIESSEGTLNTGVWMHLAGTIDKFGNAILYKNGEVVKTGLVYLPLNVNRTTNYIGKSNSSNVGYFHGHISELRVWNIARSAAEIQAYKNSRLNGDEKGLLCYWPLNEINGSTVVNKASNGHHGMVHGGPTIVEAKPPLEFRPKTYLIKSKLNGLALVGTPYNQVTTGAVDSQNPLQRWTITPDGVIKNEAGFVLDYQDYGITPYYVVIANRVQGTQGSPSQQWQVENGVIKNKHKADLVVDIAGSNPAPNTTILASPGMGGLNQQWEMVLV
ncbi:LamG-like jellyroll fold domain-containing protein [Planktothrix sp. FACHB-1365]|uniref:LamG-like jellyroll fold domain-containing protein n=1 Tax=Planktothrix sp. FACHB-1365 TaxID=2692855 RepID=UPI00168217F8|nr:LamG-like jellyroll fold domain-containing protein [Planktothrix sp. FACHB-1365]MBD2483427.1 hypothetical protein [Planktothrix sp. FACHB-1365]